MRVSEHGAQRCRTLCVGAWAKKRKKGSGRKMSKAQKVEAAEAAEEAAEEAKAAKARKARKAQIDGSIAAANPSPADLVARAEAEVMLTVGEVALR